MAEDLVCELNLALIPEMTLAEKHIAFSEGLAKQYPSVIALNGVGPRLVFTPHVTLYQVPITVRDLEQLAGKLAQLAATTQSLSLAATGYGSNPNEGSLEVRYEPAEVLMELQEALIGETNPLRGDLLLERDPAGHRLLDLVSEPGTRGDNIRSTGFDAVGDPAKGGLFHPHVTIGWFAIGTRLAMNAPDWPPIGAFDGRFEALGIFALGPYGTCAQCLRVLPLAGTKRGSRTPAGTSSTSAADATDGAT
jgi:2'-5' RNA ligase